MKRRIFGLDSLVWRGRDPDFERYGFDEVPAARRQELFNEHVPLREYGFGEIRRGFFVRKASDEIFHLMHHAVGKNATYMSWGLSLAFVPHAWTDRLQFHRTEKSAKPDLHDKIWDDRGRITYIHGEVAFVRDLKTCWTASKEPALRFWELGTSVEGVIALADEQIARPPSKFGFSADQFFPGPRFVRAFTLARLGRTTAAREALGEWKALWSDEETGGAGAALDKVLAMG